MFKSSEYFFNNKFSQSILVFAYKDTGLSSVSSSGAGVQQPAFNIVGQGQSNQIATALGQQQQTPIHQL